MKTIEEIKNEVAVKNRYGKWDDIMFYHNGGGSSLSAEKLSNMVNEVAEEYAKQRCQTQIVNCTINLNIDYPKGTEKYSDAVNSILETPNVVTTKP